MRHTWSPTECNNKYASYLVILTQTSASQVADERPKMVSPTSVLMFLRLAGNDLKEYWHIKYSIGRLT